MADRTSGRTAATGESREACGGGKAAAVKGSERKTLDEGLGTKEEEEVADRDKLDGVFFFLYFSPLTRKYFMTQFCTSKFHFVCIFKCIFVKFIGKGEGHVAEQISFTNKNNLQIIKC
jgi:hypothetical protein